MENYPQQDSFPLASWDATSNTAMLAAGSSDAGANVFYGAQDILGTRITGTLNPGRHYGLLVTAYVSSRALDPTTPATASGGVLFSIGQVPEVPSLAPAGMVLLCSVLGLAGVRSLTAVSRARRRQTPSL